MRFDLTTLNPVLAIADTRSITRGAAREHIAVGAASRRLLDLEARFVDALCPPVPESQSPPERLAP
jgi:DNA-binding transcriptional LysR family regulator